MKKGRSGLVSTTLLGSYLLVLKAPASMMQNLKQCKGNYCTLSGGKRVVVGLGYIDRRNNNLREAASEVP